MADRQEQFSKNALFEKIPFSSPAKAKNRLLSAAQQDIPQILVEYKTSFDGYDEKTANKMQTEFGKNSISKQKKDTLFMRLFASFFSPFTVVLFILAVISYVTDVLMAPAGQRDYSTVLIVLIMVFISGFMRFFQETRSGKAAEKLNKMIKTTIAVQRLYAMEQDTQKYVSQKKEIPLDELVVGDIIHLAAGDMIPADVRLLQTKDLFISQSTLTGESEPIEKFSKLIDTHINNPLDSHNLAFMGTNVISGSAIAIVIAVGDETVFGGIAHQISAKKPPTNFEKGINSVSWVLIRFMLVMVPFVLFVNGFTKGNWTEAFLFALSVAVGLTPEMLPMIVTTNLARGAVIMSRKKVIVKDLNSIQNFGAMDVLCTDKTGTLTQDRIILEYSLDIHGNEDARILRRAFLNSYHQTGLKNLMDIAVINHAGEQEMIELCKEYKKVDEIPFDFNRRRMSVVVADTAGKTQLITKGAIEEMLTVSTFVEYNNKTEPIDEKIKKEIFETVKKYNAKGMRVLAIAYKNNPSPAGAFSVTDESNMILIGFLAFLDPPKDSAKSALFALKQNGVSVKVLTGDNEAVTSYVCGHVGIKSSTVLLGSDIEKMTDGQLGTAVNTCNVFAKLSPAQKARLVTALKQNGYTVGFMGDGINDAPAMKSADVGISVDTAVDIAKESANIILLEKDLTVLNEGAVEGRKIYANIIKYIKMTASSNFGNMFSVLAASAFLPFLPMLPIQILILNLIYDICCIAIPWDNVDADYLSKPRKWDASSITKFMLWIGPTSSVFDITTFLGMYFIICPNVFGAGFQTLNESMQNQFIMLFHTAWFVESLCTQTLVIHMIRTPKIPFVQSRASVQLTVMTFAGIFAGTFLPYMSFAQDIGMYPIPAVFFAGLILTLFAYMLLATAAKKIFIRLYGDLL